MPRTLPAPLAAAIASGVARLSTVLEIQRRDGAIIRLTDAADDITLGGRVYYSVGGYERSALSVRDGIEVDDMEITGHFNDTHGVARADILARLFAGARFVMRWLDRSDPDGSSAILLSGSVGRIRPHAANSWRAELRGLKSRLGTIITPTYGYECTAQLGDKRCRIPLAPPEVQRSAAYFAGEFVRVPTHASAPARFAIPILNPGFESHVSDIPTDWTAIRGTPLTWTEIEPLNPAAGARFLAGDDPSSEFAVEQIIAITGLGVGTTEIDAGRARLSFAARRATGGVAQRDPGRALVEALDGSGGNLGALYDSRFELIGFEGRWDARGITGAAIPAGTRSIRIELDGRLRTGTGVAAAFDDIHAQIWDAGATPLGQPEWENRIYECTVAGITAGSAPVYDETPGNSTADGTATFVARESWMKDAVIAGVTDQRVFSITVTESRAVNGWFTHGVIHWESGANAGLGMEVKRWTAAGSVIELFMPMRRTIQVGDKLRIFPGCARALTICRDKFDNVINYRGHPHIPGNDYIATYPDAR